MLSTTTVIAYGLWLALVLGFIGYVLFWNLYPHDSGPGAYMLVCTDGTTVNFYSAHKAKRAAFMRAIYTGRGYQVRHAGEVIYEIKPQH